MRGSFGRFVASAVLLVATCVPLFGGDPPKLGYSKAELKYLVAIPNASTSVLLRLPDASSPASIADDVPFEILEEYNQYPDWVAWIISVKTDLMDRLRQLAPAGMLVTKRDEFDLMYLADHSYDTRLPFAPDTLGLPPADYASGQFGLYAIQFHSPLKAEWIDAMRSAGAICPDWFIGLYSSRVDALIGATPEIAAAVRELPFVQWSTALHPYLKDAPYAYQYHDGVVKADVTIVRMPGSDEARMRAETLKEPRTSFACYRYDQMDVCSGSWSVSAVAQILAQPSVVEIIVPTPIPLPPGGDPPVYPSIPTLSFAAVIGLALILAIAAIARLR